MSNQFLRALTYLLMKSEIYALVLHVAYEKKTALLIVIFGILERVISWIACAAKTTCNIWTQYKSNFLAR